jgi:hypothetical protein
MYKEVSCEKALGYIKALLLLLEALLKGDLAKWFS